MEPLAPSSPALSSTSDRQPWPLPTVWLDLSSPSGVECSINNGTRGRGCMPAPGDGLSPRNSDWTKPVWGQSWTSQTPRSIYLDPEPQPEQGTCQQARVDSEAYLCPALRSCPSDMVAKVLLLLVSLGDKTPMLSSHWPLGRQTGFFLPP